MPTEEPRPGEQPADNVFTLFYRRWPKSGRVQLMLLVSGGGPARLVHHEFIEAALADARAAELMKQFDVPASRFFKSTMHTA